MSHRTLASLAFLAGSLVLLVGSGELVPEPDRDLRLAAEQADSDAAGVAARQALLDQAADRHNVEACKRWVDQFNALECVPESVRIDPVVQCPETLDLAPCDQSAYWACMADKTTCDGPIPQRPAASECPPPCG